MLESTPSPPTDAKATPTVTEDSSPNIDRRSVVKGAAWSLPVIAAAVATPAFATSAGWNISVTVGCLANVAGLSVLPGFLIEETTNRTPITPLTFTQTVRYSGTYALGDLGYAAAVTAGLLLFTTYQTVALVSSNSTRLTTTAYSTPTPVRTGTTSGTVTLTSTRTVTVTGLPRSGRAGIGYLIGGGLSVGELTQFTNTLTANPDSGGSITTDNTATLPTNLLSLGC